MCRGFWNALSVGAVCLMSLSATLADSSTKDTPKSAKPEKEAPPATAKNPAPKFHLEQTPIQREGTIAHSFASVIKKAAPSVVSVFSSRTVSEQEMRNPFLDPFLRKYFGGNGGNDGADEGDDDAEPQPRRNNNGNRDRSRGSRSHQEMGLGSGVIVTEDGYILTNNHVIEGADDVKVETSAGVRYKAKVVGADPATDIAVLRIEADKLPALTIANSDALEVGDVVLAIGNPFGLGQTVTMGIISATGRGELGILGQGGYEDFIQTDAAINMGNSGGALVDSQGRLIGMNAAILSRTGGNVGVGFAVPINMARMVMEQLTASGKVSRGMLGVKPQKVTPELAREFKLPDASGALIAGFTPNGVSPAREAGVKEGDVIVEFNGKKVTDDTHLRLMVSQTPPNTESTIKLYRDGKEKTIKLKLAELPSMDVAENDREIPGKKGNDNEALEGVSVDNLDAAMRRQFSIPRTVDGVIVTDVDPDSKSYEEGLRPGDVILDIDRKPVRSADEAVKMTENVKGDSVLLRIWRRGNARYLGPIENGRSEKAAKPSTKPDREKQRR